jgi:CBS domain-containing protein
MDNTVARDIMSTDLITIRENETLEDALKSLINHKVTGLPVVDAKGRMIGVVSEYDLIRQLSRHKKLKPGIFQEKIEYSKKPFGILPSLPLDKVVRHFVESKFRRLPVVDKDGMLVGIITRRDLMRIYFYRAKLS